MKTKLFMLLLVSTSLINAQTFITAKSGAYFSNTKRSYYNSKDMVSFTGSIGIEQVIADYFSVAANASFFQDGYRMSFITTDQNGGTMSSGYDLNSYTDMLSVNVPIKISYPIGAVKLYAFAGPSVNLSFGTGLRYLGGDKESYHELVSPTYTNLSAYIGAGLDFHKTKSRFSIFAEFATNSIREKNFFAVAGVKYKIIK